MIYIDIKNGVLPSNTNIQVEYMYRYVNAGKGHHQKKIKQGDWWERNITNSRYGAQTAVPRQPFVLACCMNAAIDVDRVYRMISSGDVHNLAGGLEHEFIFSIQLGIMIPTDSYFSEG